MRNVINFHPIQYRTKIAAWFIFTLAIVLYPITSVAKTLNNEMGAKVTWSEDKRFKDHGDGSISDTKTNLMWAKKDSYQLTGHWLNWAQGKEFVDAFNEKGFADHYDWRLPTKSELITLYEGHKLNSAQLGHGMAIHIDPVFAKEGTGAMWSSETNGSFSAYGIVFNDGSSFSAHKNSKARKSVRAVRNLNPKTSTTRQDRK